MDEQEFKLLMDSCAEIGEMFPEGVVFIGGIAVHLHAVNSGVKKMTEFTHDGDFYISLADMADLRDCEEVTPNRRLSKHQMVKNGFEFDIYTERQSSLIVPYDEVISRASVYGSVKAASVEHLMALKLEAYRDRKSSKKGEKDARDIARLCVLSGGVFDAVECAKYLTDEHAELLARVERGPEILKLADGNAHEAKGVRALVSEMRKAVEAALKSGFNSGPGPASVPKCG